MRLPILYNLDLDGRKVTKCKCPFLTQTGSQPFRAEQARAGGPRYRQSPLPKGLSHKGLKLLGCLDHAAPGPHDRRPC